MQDFHVLKARGVIRDENGKVFLSYIPKAGFFCLPGGTMESGETFRECVEREILEETGIKPQVGKPLGVYEFHNSRGGLQLEIWFEIVNFEDFKNLDKSCATHGHECSDEGFYSFEEIQKMTVRPVDLKKIFENIFSVL